MDPKISILSGINATSPTPPSGDCSIMDTDSLYPNIINVTDPQISISSGVDATSPNPPSGDSSIMETDSLHPNFVTSQSGDYNNIINAMDPKISILSGVDATSPNPNFVTSQSGDYINAMDPKISGVDATFVNPPSGDYRIMDSDSPHPNFVNSCSKDYNIINVKDPQVLSGHTDCDLITSHSNSLSPTTCHERISPVASPMKSPMQKVRRRERTGTEGKTENERACAAELPGFKTANTPLQTPIKSIMDFCIGLGEGDTIASFQLESFGYILRKMAIDRQLEPSSKQVVISYQEYLATI